MAEFQRFELQQNEDVTILHLADPKLFDALTISELEDELLKMIDELKPPKVLVNFAPSSIARHRSLMASCRTKKKLLAINGQIKLCGMRDTLREAYRLLNLEGTVFQIYDSANEALWDFGVRISRRVAAAFDATLNTFTAQGFSAGLAQIWINLTTTSKACSISSKHAHSSGEWRLCCPVDRLGVGNPRSVNREPSVPPRTMVNFGSRPKCR